MTEESVAVVFYWILALPFLGIGVWILLFNVLRYTPIVRGRVEDRAERLPSSTPFVGSILFLLGLWISPADWQPAYFLVLLTEVFSIDFSASPTDNESPDASHEE